MKNKEQRIYLEGMAYAYKIVKEGGMEALEREVKFRGLNNIPLNVNADQLIAISRGRSKEELMFVATAMAETMTEYMKMPPSIIKDYLKKFNERIEEYRMDPEVFNKAQDNLNRNIGLNEMVEQYRKEDMNNGKN